MCGGIGESIIRLLPSINKILPTSILARAASPGDGDWATKKKLEDSRLNGKFDCFRRRKTEVPVHATSVSEVAGWEMRTSSSRGIAVRHLGTNERRLIAATWRYRTVSRGSASLTSSSGRAGCVTSAGHVPRGSHDLGISSPWIEWNYPQSVKHWAGWRYSPSARPSGYTQRWQPRFCPTCSLRS